jgi:hypothetical protein
VKSGSVLNLCDGDDVYVRSFWFLFLSCFAVGVICNDPSVESGSGHRNVLVNELNVACRAPRKKIGKTILATMRTLSKHYR